ncbi:hypothetical protein WJX72_003947 [[Myrmecia] bisecta]|uniref:Uncharacterized protein n=1 Tax=[Myrmecia] bisecta TaxID=41462 RepID=A0AAW1QEQ6_9CHLO
MDLTRSTRAVQHQLVSPSRPACVQAASHLRAQHLISRFTPQTVQQAPARGGHTCCQASERGQGGESGSGEFIPDNLPLAGTDTDWRAFRARLVASSTSSGSSRLDAGRLWAHNLPGAEEGCLLIAHPLMFGQSQPYFRLAVVFLFQHDNMGSAGLILNRKTDITVGAMSGTSALSPEFAPCPLYLGGDVGQNTLHLLHGHGGLEGAKETVSGVFQGGVNAAQKAVRRGDLPAESFRWFTHYCGWGPGQLDKELEAGVWFAAAASPELILKQSGSTPDALWHEVLELMGGEHAQLSRSMKEEYRADIMEYRPEEAPQNKAEGPADGPQNKGSSP